MGWDASEFRIVESGEGWHFAGANFPGSPFPFLGHNETLGWTNTVNTPDMIDIYKLVLDDSGTRYRLDGKLLGVPHMTGYDGTEFDKEDPQYSMQKPD